MKDFSRYKSRRAELVRQVKANHPDRERGLIVLFAGFEGERTVFRQDSTFFYFTGIREPGLALVLDFAGTETLYVPNCGKNRLQWVKESVDLSPKGAVALQLSSIETLGQECGGYQFHPFFKKVLYETLIGRIADCVTQEGMIGSTVPDNESEYVEPRFLWMRLKEFIPNLGAALVDLSPSIARMRRTKEQHELEKLYNAIGTTALAQEAAARAIRPGMSECEAQAHLEFLMTGSCSRIAFPSIVGSGPNSTILHYTANDRLMEEGELVVVDIGAECDNYCADITRTYPVSGSFTSRQKELYELVLATQEYIAGLAKPGMWLSNNEHPDQSLNHLARKFLADRGGYDKYFPHGIGHFLGLDVHDVGDLSQPLQPGDVITIEPGVYIPEEQIGIRIEDDYWIVDDGVMCLSEQIPKSVTEVEQMAQQGLDEPEQEASSFEDEIKAES